jgi:hypothetical protein
MRRSSRFPSSRRLLTGLAVISILLLLFAIFLAWRDFTTPRVASPPAQPHSSGILIYRVTLDSFDIDTRIIRGDLRVLLSKVPTKSASSQVTKYPPAFYCSNNALFTLDLASSPVFVDASPGTGIEDLGRTYVAGGLRAIQDVLPLGQCDPSAPGSKFVRIAGPPQPQFGTFAQLGHGQAELFAVGDPRMFPFDKYLVVYRVWVPVLVQRSGGRYVGILGFNEVDNHVPGFFVRYATPRELETWPAVATRGSHPVQIKYDESMWAGKQEAVVLERSSFFQAITIFLALVACGYLVWFAFTKHPNRWFPDILGFFLTVWAIREALSVGAPRTPTLIDYSALCFYVAFISVMLWKFARERRTMGR